MTKQIPSWMVQYKEEAEFQDKIIKGSIEYTNKTKEQQAKEILSLKGTEPSTVVAKRYNIHCSTVCYIWKGTLWRYL